MDRARQEVKELHVQQSKASEQHGALEKQLRQDIQAAQSAAATASQSADILRGKCDTPFRIMYIMLITPLPDPGFTSHAPDPLQAPA